ncbi:hypothetical protein [Pseudochryseolinea flava]|uniref:Uncharacterized protein n=1 Tax=Pseudochryseolinea flava TaxID=2059302 RepID=A0A364XWE7_9BACT|nr:hypothetical protein [Pseudochryseolinea flava]RAV98717.1 hypothetical protein DQQ10_22130 [Pseudochryseolinea flava]
MQYLNEVMPTEELSSNSQVMIRVWENFLDHRQNLSEILGIYSLTDVCTDLDFRGTVTFNFTLFDWQRTLKAMLEKNNVPYIQGNISNQASLN